MGGHHRGDVWPTPSTPTPSSSGSYRHARCPRSRCCSAATAPSALGQKVRLSEACAKLGRDNKETGPADIIALKGQKRVAKGTVVDAGVRFFVEPEYEEDALREKVAMDLLPKKQHPQAWRIKRGGGQVKAEIGPLVDE